VNWHLEQTLSSKASVRQPAQIQQRRCGRKIRDSRSVRVDPSGWNPRRCINNRSETQKIVAHTGREHQDDHRRRQKRRLGQQDDEGPATEPQAAEQGNVIADRGKGHLAS
jgi:hypothetical protein